MASVQIRDVQKSFGGTQVIRGVSIDIPDGEFTVLVGPSGCGKSTLLRMLAGLEEISGGEIAIGDRVVNRLPPKERDIAMVFQNYALYPHMSVYDNMAFSLKLAGVAKQTIKDKVDKASGILGLGALLDRYPRQLSGGQRQRVAMGRAIVRDPQVFLFDEPLSNLDAKLRVQMRAEIKELHQRLRTTSVYVTHDQIEAMTMADQIVVMRDGRVEQRGRPLALYDHPDNLFVAGFIGSPAMNFVPGVLRRQNGEARVEFPDGTLLPAPARLQDGAGTDGQRVIYGVRPEHLAYGAPGQGFPTTVAVVEPTGANTEVYSRFGETDFISVFRERHDFAAGQALHLVPDHHHTHLFDAESGQALPRQTARQ
ncbi:ABC transporter ATP-binding protein [Cupriavidus pauculus]|uniref:Sugar ABC transporter ATP-binding protein n=1 Tax=Cupriavidus pauculus TaxID=82633 RepID=A0A2N5C670_9BURK|nr:sn-glycerol-3-phosphate ABC transporter ATP-binding protein UgpC [Cupriavidus pauculus]PLP97716.1 sugar ABC transporter ATP-binding protein [Cupriavidus pauculus]